MISQTYLEPFSTLAARLSYRNDGRGHYVVLEMLAYESEPEISRFDSVEDARSHWRAVEGRLYAAGFGRRGKAEATPDDASEKGKVGRARRQKQAA